MNGILAIGIVAALGSQMLNPARAASHMDAPLLAFDAVEFEGHGPEFAADGRLVAVDDVRFRALAADGRALEGSGALSLPATQGDGDQATRGIVDGILGRLDDPAGGSPLRFTGWALVDLASIAVEEQNFTASGALRLDAEFLAPAGDVLNLRVDEVLTLTTEPAADGMLGGVVEVRFSGVGRRGGVAVTVDGSAEFRFQGDVADGIDWFAAGGWTGTQSDLANAFQGDSADGVDWFLAGGEWRILNATLADAATGGALLFEDLAGRVGTAQILGAIDASGQVGLAGALGQVTMDW